MNFSKASILVMVVGLIISTSLFAQKVTTDLDKTADQEALKSKFDSCIKM